MSANSRRTKLVSDLKGECVGRSNTNRDKGRTPGYDPQPSLIVDCKVSGYNQCLSK